MSKVFVNIGLSLDGYMAPEGMSIEHWSTPNYKDWGAKWGALMGWVLKQQYFRENLKFGPGGETGQVNDMLRHTMQRSGANILGKRMFEQGEISWPDRIEPNMMPSVSGSRSRPALVGEAPLTICR